MRRENFFSRFSLSSCFKEAMDIKRKATDGAVVPFKKPRSDIVAYGGQDNAVMQMVFF